MGTGMKHYTKDGKVFNGNFHKMSNGKLHTGKIHTASSKPLFHLNELPKKIQKKLHKNFLPVES